MSTDTLTIYQAQTKTNRIGLWLFLVSEAFLFGGLLASRFYLWGNTRPDLDQTVGLIVTTVLLLSSFSMNRAERLSPGEWEEATATVLLTPV